MFERHPAQRYPALGGAVRATTAAHRSVARERAPRYDAARPTVEWVTAKLDDAIDELNALLDDGCSDADLNEAVVSVVDVQTRLAAAEARLVDQVHSRETYVRDACVSAVTWLRFRTNLGWSDARRRWKRARVLGRMPLLADAFATGRVSACHVDAVVNRVTPWRLTAVAEADETLTALACDADPKDVATAVAKIVELVDRDGSDDPPPCDRDKLRELRLRTGFDGTHTLTGTLTPLLAELFHRANDVFSTPVPPDTPFEEQRTPSQKFHDAVARALAKALDLTPAARAGGIKTHVVGFADILSLMGADAAAAIRPRLSRIGPVDPATFRHILATSDSVTLRVILGLGPWRPITVSRAHRVLPDWLRTASELTHQHCRGPGCDRPFAWTEADHNVRWADGGHTALFNDAPLCDAHHDLKEHGRWEVRFDPDTGEVTWTSSDGRRFTLPPPEP